MIPSFQAILLPFLKSIADGNVHAISELLVILGKSFNLTDDELIIRIPSGSQGLFENRLNWAATYLKFAGLIERKERSHYQITKEGKKILSKELEELDVKYLKTIPSFSAWITNKSNNSKKNELPTKLGIEELEKSPEELLDESFNLLTDQLKSELLEQIKACKPAFFEQVVIDLLTKMGYGGSKREAGEVVGRSGDGGIDGVINEDKLGLDSIYIQAKKWDATIPISAVRDFAGALLSKKAKKGIFITTSSFPVSAIEFVKSIEPRIVLIDGKQLAELMIEYNIGVSVKNLYEIKKIDSDYFL